MTEPKHPSFFALDLLRLGEASDDVRGHVSACAACRSFVEGLDHPATLPGWVVIEAEKARTNARGWRVRLWGAVIAGPLAALVAFLMVVPTEHGAESEQKLGVRVKGMPSLSIYVKQGNDTQLWNGRDVLRPGDLLMLRVVPEAFTHVTVLELEKDQPRVLHAGAVAPGAATTLPRSWRLDAAPGPQRLWVVFGHETPNPAELKTLIRDEPRDDSSWVTRIELPKEGEGR